MVHLIEHLDRSKINPIAVCPEPGELSEKLESIACPTIFIPLFSIKPKHYLDVWKSYKMMKEFIVSEEIDILHPDRDADALLFGLAKRNTKTKMIWHARVNAPNKKDKWNFNLSDGVIGVSNAAGKRFENFNNFNQKYKTIFNGVDTDLFKPVESKPLVRKELGLSPDKFHLMFVGQITKGKGIFDLINAASILNEHKESRKVLQVLFIGAFAGNSGEKEFNSRINSLQLNDIIEYIPQQKNIERWMQAADALIIPSHEGVEGMPRVLYEAMACGAVGIGSDTSGVRETIDTNSGLLVIEKSPEDIADKIKLLIENKDLLYKLQANGRKRAVKMFDIRRHAREIEKFYEYIMNI